MDEKENSNYSETINNEIPVGISYDVFSENTAASAEKTKAAKREYLDAFFQGDLKFENAEILMTRSQYVADATRLEEYYKSETKKTAKQYLWALVVFAAMEIVRLFLELFYEVARDVIGLGNIVYMALLATVIVFPIIILCIIISTTKNLVMLKRKYNDSVKRLEQRKQDLMQSGQYDASN